MGQSWQQFQFQAPESLQLNFFFFLHSKLKEMITFIFQTNFFTQPARQHVEATQEVNSVSCLDFTIRASVPCSSSFYIYRLFRLRSLTFIAVSRQRCSSPLPQNVACVCVIPLTSDPCSCLVRLLGLLSGQTEETATEYKKCCRPLTDGGR